MSQTQKHETTAELGFLDLLAMLWRRKWLLLLCTTLGIGAAHLYTARLHYRWKASAQMIVIQRGSVQSGNASEASYSAPLMENAETQVQMIQSDGMAQRTLDWLKNKAFAEKKTLRDLGVTDENELHDKFASLVTVKVPTDTNLLAISATGPTAEQSAVLTNAICQAFVQWKKDVAQANVREITASLETRAKRARDQMLSAEQAETAFKKRNRLVDVPEQFKSSLSHYLSYDAEVADLKQDVASQSARVAALAGQLGATDKSIREGEGVRDDALVQTLQRQLNDLEIERAKTALTYTPEFPGLLPNYDSQIKDLRDRLTRAVQGTLDNKRPSLTAQDALAQNYKQAELGLIFSRAKLTGAAAQRDTLKRSLAGVPDASMQYARLARSSEMAQHLHSSLQASLNAVRVNNDLVSGNVQVTSEAIVPDAPFFPSRSRNLLLGGMLGLGTAMLCSFLLQNADHAVRTLNHARRLASGPIIGTLPRMSRSAIRDLENGGASPFALEAYSLARANLALTARATLKDEPWTKQVILITSAVPGEGKSLTAAYIARSLARSGKSVVLVDADLRRPAMNRLFSTAETTGLADVLIGQTTLEEALVSSDTDNLFVLHSGVPDRNPMELISRPEMSQTLARLRETADIVIVDTPACVAVADALLLAPHADCIVQVIGLGKANEEMTLETTSTLRAAAPKTLVYFVNRAPRSARHAYTKYYHYENRRELVARPAFTADNALPPAAGRDEDGTLS